MASCDFLSSWSACPCDASAGKVVFTLRLPDLSVSLETPAPFFVARACQRHRIGHNQDRSGREPSTMVVGEDVVELLTEVYI
jgi:hypothetical protein